MARSSDKANEFYSLPLEVRTKIYKLIFHNIEIDICDPGRNPTVMPREGMKYVIRYDRTKHNPSFLLTSRQIYFESLPIFYSGASFNVKTRSLCPLLTPSIGAQQFRHVRNISISNFPLYIIGNFVDAHALPSLRNIVVKSAVMYIFSFAAASRLWPELPERRNLNDDSKSLRSRMLTIRNKQYDFGPLNMKALESLLFDPHEGTYAWLSTDASTEANVEPNNDTEPGVWRDIFTTKIGIVRSDGIKPLKAVLDNSKCNIQIYVRIIIHDQSWSTENERPIYKSFMAAHPHSKLVGREQLAAEVPIGFWDVRNDKLIQTSSDDLPW